MSVVFNVSKIVPLLKKAAKNGNLRAQGLDEEYAYITTDHFAIRTKLKRLKLECKMLEYRENAGIDTFLASLKEKETFTILRTQLAVLINGEPCMMFWREGIGVSYVNKKYLDLIVLGYKACAIGNKYPLIKIGDDEGEWLVIAPMVFTPTETERSVYKYLAEESINKEEQQ